ncbi:MAG: TonB-dependent receptor [Candidatus Aminicenantia bacterium]
MKKFFFIILVQIFIATPLFSLETGEIKGKVVDKKGEPLPGVTVIAESPKLQGKRITNSLNDGTFVLPLLPPGLYKITFELSGFSKVIIEKVEVNLGLTTNINVEMEERKIEESILVVAEPPFIDRSSTDTSYRITSQDITLLPSKTRTVSDLVKFAPGVTGVRSNTKKGTYENGLPSFRGEGEEGNNWLVDGLSTRGVRLAKDGVRVNFDALEEIQIISDPFSPELASSFGGIINVLTKSGGNEFHGEAGTLFVDKALQARREPQLSISFEPSDYSSYNNYFNLGGPIKKDKIWFFFSENTFFTKDISHDNFIDYMFVPGGERETFTNNFFGKLSYAIDSNHALILSGSFSKLLSQKGGIGFKELYRKDNYSDTMLRIGYKGIISVNTFIESSLGITDSKSSFAPAHENMGPSMYFIEDIAQNINNFLGRVIDNEKRFDFVLRLNHVLPLRGLGSHELGAGFEFYKNSSEFTSSFTGKDEDPFPENEFKNGTKYSFLSWKEGKRTPTLLWEYGNFNFVNSISGIGIYLKDRITIERFTFLLGFRSATQTNYDDKGNILWKWDIRDFLSPRFSFACDITNDGKNVFKIGYGIFTDTTTTFHLAFFNPQAPLQFRRYAWIGPENPNPSQLHNPSNWKFLNEERRGPFEIAENIKPNRLSRFLIEFDRKLGKNWALKTRYVQTFAKNLLELLGFFDLNPPYYKFVFDNFEYKRRNYKGFEVELNGRVKERLNINFSYCYSSAMGTNPGQVETGSWSQEEGSTNYVSLFGKHIYVPPLPELMELKQLLDWGFGGLGGREYGDEGWYGKLPYSVDHNIKLNINYIGPFGSVLSIAFEWLSGYHWEKLGLVPFFGYYAFPEGRGSRETPSHYYFDIGIQKSFSLSDLIKSFPENLKLDVRLDIFNLFNSQKPISFVKEDTLAFGQIWGRQNPREARITLRMRW